MGRKDTCEKDFVADNRVFADIVNGVVFSGEQVVKPEDLSELDTTEVFADTVSGIKLDAQKYRDVLKYATIKTTGRCHYAIVGVENQTSVNYAMPVRVMVYDGLNYTAQVVATTKQHQEEKGKASLDDYFTGIRKDDTIIPVVTIVIYWGTKPWDGPRSLHEMFPADTPKEILGLVPDYKIPILCPAEVKDPSVFQTDLRPVFKAIAAGGNKRQLQKLYKSDPDFNSISRQAAIVINEVTKMDIPIPDGTEEVHMCKAVEEWRAELLAEGEAKGKAEGLAKGKVEGIAEGEAKGKAEGRAEGIAEGEAKGKENTVVDMINSGMITLQQGADHLGISKAKMEKIIAARQ